MIPQARPAMSDMKQLSFWTTTVTIVAGITLSSMGLTPSYLPASQVCPAGSSLQNLTVIDFATSILDGKIASGVFDGETQADIDAAFKTVLASAKSSFGTMDDHKTIGSWCARHEETGSDIVEMVWGPNYNYVPSNFIDILLETKVKAIVDEDEKPTKEAVCAAATRDTPICTVALFPEDTTVTPEGDAANFAVTASKNWRYQRQNKGADDPAVFNSLDTLLSDGMCHPATAAHPCCVAVKASEAGFTGAIADKYMAVCKTEPGDDECESASWDSSSSSQQCVSTFKKDTAVGFCYHNSFITQEPYNFLSGGKLPGIKTDVVEKAWSKNWEIDLGLDGIVSSAVDAYQFECPTGLTRGNNCTTIADSIEYCYDDVEGWGIFLAAIITVTVGIFLKFGYDEMNGSQANGSESDLGDVKARRVFFVVNIILLGIAYGYTFSRFIDVDPQVRQRAALGLSLAAVLQSVFAVAIGRLYRDQKLGEDFFTSSNMMTSNSGGWA